MELGSQGNFFPLGHVVGVSEYMFTDSVCIVDIVVHNRITYVSI